MTNATETIIRQTTCRVAKTVRPFDQDETIEESQEVIDIHEFATTPAMVNVEIPLKMTKNYNSIGITVGVTLPCYAEEVENGIEVAKALVMRRVHAEIPNLKIALNNIKG